MLILHELGGLNPCTLEFGVRQSRRGWKVYMPRLDSDYGMCSPVRHGLRMNQSKLWDARNPAGTGPIYHDLEQLVDWISSLHHGERVVVMGNCLTGAYPLGLLARRSVKTAVLCQPAMPLPGTLEFLTGKEQSPAVQASLGLSSGQLHDLVKAVKNDPTKKIIGFHYLKDPVASFEKFETIHKLLKSRFHAVVMVPAITGSQWYEQHVTKAPQDKLHPHSTVTGAENGQKVAECRDRDFFQRRFNELVRP